MTESAETPRPWPRPLWWPLWISLALLCVLFALAGSILPLYHVIVGGPILWLLARRAPVVAARLQAWPLPVRLRVLVLGWGAVVAEEMLVGTIATLDAGGGLAMWPERMGQFVLFNLFAFAGPILALALLGPVLRRGPADLWIWAGGWGLFAESIYRWVFSNPLGALALILPTMATYSAILGPAFLSMPQGRRDWPAPVRLAALWGLSFALALPFILAVSALRSEWPGAFPPCDLIACS